MTEPVHTPAYFDWKTQFIIKEITILSAFRITTLRCLAGTKFVSRSNTPKAKREVRQCRCKKESGSIAEERNKL